MNKIIELLKEKPYIIPSKLLSFFKFFKFNHLLFILLIRI